MFEFKLQLGCLLIILFFTINYVKETNEKGVTCSSFFDAMLYIAPWAIVFDGVTAWTVNHMDIVPNYVNVICHAIFFVLMNALTSVLFVFMINETIGIDSPKQMKLLLAPGAITIAFVLAFMSKIRFVIGEKTNYSLGTSVYICFISLFLHYLVIAGILIFHHRTIEKRKMFSLTLFMVISFGLLVAQLLLPEILITSLIPTMAIIILYIYFENPSFRRLQNSNAKMVTSFATLVENRDSNTGGHILRTREYVRILIDDLWKIGKYRSVITKDYVRCVLGAAPLHDVGKIATPDNILNKPGKLTDEEYEIMKTHSSIGGDIINKTFAGISDPQYHKIAYEVAKYHHEKWNGRGYPEGLSGEDIPLHARIMAIADVFDAVSAKRVYRDALPLSTCFKIIEDGAGTDFDPELVSLFMDSKDEIISYYNSVREEHHDL